MKKVLIIIDITMVILLITLGVLVTFKYNSGKVEYRDVYVNDISHTIICTQDNIKYEFKTDKDYMINEIIKNSNSQTITIDSSRIDNKFFEAYYNEVLGSSFTCKEDL